MEFVDGTTLAELIAERGPLDLGRAGEIAGQLLAGLEAIHAAGLVHRDLKPENVMLTLSRRVVVMDFGIARSLTELQRGNQLRARPATCHRSKPPGCRSMRAPTCSRPPWFWRRWCRPRRRRTSGRKSIWGRAAAGSTAGPGRTVEPGAPACAQSFAGRPLRIRGCVGSRPGTPATGTGRVEESPYPGLLHFTEENARFFVGRELEVESLLRRLRRPRLRAVIGPSGAGKSSFLRAGLLPALPTGWSALVCTPTDRPLATLAQTLAPELAGDARGGAAPATFRRSGHV